MLEPCAQLVLPVLLLPKYGPKDCGAGEGAAEGAGEGAAKATAGKRRPEEVRSTCEPPPALARRGFGRTKPPPPPRRPPPPPPAAKCGEPSELPALRELVKEGVGESGLAGENSAGGEREDGAGREDAEIASASWELGREAGRGGVESAGIADPGLISMPEGGHGGACCVDVGRTRGSGVPVARRALGSGRPVVSRLPLPEGMLASEACEARSDDEEILRIGTVRRTSNVSAGYGSTEAGLSR